MTVQFHYNTKRLVSCEAVVVKLFCNNPSFVHFEAFSMLPILPNKRKYNKMNFDNLNYQVFSTFNSLLDFYLFLPCALNSCFPSLWGKNGLNKYSNINAIQKLKIITSICFFGRIKPIHHFSPFNFQDLIFTDD